MTRDEVLDDVMEILRQEGYADQGETISRLRALMSKPPEKSPEVETLESGRAERDALRAEVARLKWGASDAPMLGEHSGHPSTCPACRDGYPPPPGEPAPR